jgi:cathepsin L
VAGSHALLPVLNEEATNLFDAWKAQYDIKFNSLVEEEKRLLIFIENMEKIVAHNARYAKGEVSYDLSLNHYAHMTFDEFKAGFMQYKAPENYVSGCSNVHTASTMRGGRNLASTVDWREKGAVTDIKDQGQCGSCWSFSTTGSIEGAHYLATGELISLSEQQLLNCVHDGECTCDYGGLMDWGFEYVISVGGIVSEDDMPYKNISGGPLGTCPYPASSKYMTASSFAATISSYTDVTTNDEDALASALNQQPVSIAIDASDYSFQFYNSGVYDPDSCCENGECTMSDLDHGVLAVGYGSENGVDYWLVKNSWSTSWGDAGYVKMVKGKGSKCGVATSASYPVV